MLCNRSWDGRKIHEQLGRGLPEINPRAEKLHQKNKEEEEDKGGEGGGSWLAGSTLLLHNPNGALAELRRAFLQLTPLQLLAVAMAPTPLTSPGFTHVGYHLGRGTSRHVSVEETQRSKLPKQLRLEMTHDLLLGGNYLLGRATCGTASRGFLDMLAQLFEKLFVFFLGGSGVVIASTKMEQKPVFEKPEKEGIKSNGPMCAGAWPRRMVLRCVTVAAASLAKRGPHTAASYDAH